MRNVEVSHRRAQRETLRRQRQEVRQVAESARDAARRQKQWAKEEKWLQQSGEAAQFEQYMDALVTLHTEASEAWDWQAWSQTPPPTAPFHDSTAQSAARSALEAYQPGLLDRISGAAKARHAQLEADLALQTRPSTTPRTPDFNRTGSFGRRAFGSRLRSCDSICMRAMRR